MPTVIIHLQNEDPILGEVDALPTATDTLIILKSPRMKDGKDLRNLEANVTMAIWPISRVSFIEVLPSGEEEEIITFVRE
jgi:hypothetical protein